MNTGNFRKDEVRYALKLVWHENPLHEKAEQGEFKNITLSKGFWGQYICTFLNEPSRITPSTSTPLKYIDEECVSVIFQRWTKLFGANQIIPCSINLTAVFVATLQGERKCNHFSINTRQWIVSLILLWDVLEKLTLESFKLLLSLKGVMSVQPWLHFLLP